MGKKRAALGIGVVVVVLVVTGCGSDDEVEPMTGLGSDGGSNGSNSPWTELPGPTLNFAGGAAEDGLASAGGQVHLVSRGGITLDPATPPAASVEAPAVPPEATTVSSGQLRADLVTTGPLLIAGDVTTAGPEPERTITAQSGDIFVQGRLRAGDLGGVRQSLRLAAPGGTVWIVGDLDAAGEGNGQSGGGVAIVAGRVVVVGKIATSGAKATGGPAGNAGPVSIVATTTVEVTGAVDAMGGDAGGKAAALPGVAGGRGGDVAIRAGSDVSLSGKLRLRGGAAIGAGSEAWGGAAGTLAIESDGAAVLGGIVDSRGGLAKTGGGAGVAGAGAAGALRVGEVAPPLGLILAAPISLDGGEGIAAGAGGNLTLEARGGELVIAGTIDANGGGSAFVPGAGGTVTGRAGNAAGTRLVGRVNLRGGSIAAGSAGNGAEAGTLTLTADADPAPLTVEPAAEVNLDGGTSAGTGVAGGGGHLFFETRDGNISMAGTLWLRGGTAPDPGGTGGLGGAVDIFTDRNTNGIGGNLTIEATGLIDASGGPGTIGGSGRNDGGWGIALFPQGQEMIAVLLNSDGIHGTPVDGILVNLGTILTRGAPGDGWGGDVMFHGKGVEGANDPAPGHVEADAHGAGQVGQVGME